MELVENSSSVGLNFPEVPIGTRLPIARTIVVALPLGSNVPR